MIFDRLSRATLRADVSWSDLDPRWYQSEPSFGAGNFAGFPVTAESAARVSTVFACVGLRADTLATLPCHLYRRLDNGGKERAKDHPMYSVIRRKPNAWMTAADFFGFGEWHTSMVGGVVAQIRERRSGVELVPYHPSLVTVDQLETGRMRYRVRDPKGGAELALSQDEVVHIRDLTVNGVVGLSRLSLAREAIAVAAAGEAFVGGFFKHDATGRLVISHKGAPPPNPEERKRRAAEFSENYAGWANRSKTLALWNDAQVTEIGREMDGNFIVDPRKFQVSDVARFWRVPGFMIGLEEKSTSWGSGIEQQKQGWVDFTVRAMATRWEQALARDLLHEDEQEEYFFEFNFDDLLRGDTLATVQAMAIERLHGALNANEWRIIRNRNPRTDPGGEEYQDTPTGAAPNADKRSVNPEEDEEEKPTATGTLPGPLLADAAARIAGAETGEVERRLPKAKADGLKFVAWARGFFAEQKSFTVKVLAPLAEAYGFESWVVDTIAARVEQSGVGAMSLDGAPATWLTSRRDEVAVLIDETFRAGAAVRRAA